MSLSHMIGSADSALTCAPEGEAGKKDRQLPPPSTLHIMEHNSMTTDNIQPSVSFLQLASVPGPTQLSTTCRIVLQVMEEGGA